jgi:NhaP-type Na+/H+ or K+/H+ antiporter
VLALLATLLNALLIAVVVRYIFPYGWTWLERLLFASILAATDPVEGE